MVHQKVFTTGARAVLEGAFNHGHTHRETLRIILTSPRTMCSGCAYMRAWFGPTCCCRWRATLAVSDGCDHTDH